MSRSVKYGIAIVVLLAANLWLFFSGSDKSIQPAEKYFEAGLLDNVTGFDFSTEESNVKLTLGPQGWIVNDQYPADQGFVNTLISVLERVEARNTIENWNSESLGEVSISAENRSIDFQFSINPNKTRSYFIVDGEAREVTVPGYRDNVVDIFTLHPDQWRDRTILDGSWRTIQKINVQNENGENFEIAFQDKFFLVNGQQPSDSSAVVEYLNQFQQFQANEMISPGRFDEMDSLAKTAPFAEITIDDFKNEVPVTLRIFPNSEGQPWHLVKDQDDQQMVIDARRVRQILTNPERLN